MQRIMLCTVLLGLISSVNAEITIRVYESDGMTLFDGRKIPVGTELKLIVASDANDFWRGGLFLRDGSRDLAALSGSGYDPNTWDWTDCHYSSAGLEALVTWWEDSVIEGFDLFSDPNDRAPGNWFCIDYTALAPGDPNVGIYDYSISWDEPNDSIVFCQVPPSDFNLDGLVNFLDYTLLASCWQEDDCTDPNGCQKADLDADGVVDCNDLMLFAADWLWGAPEPNEPTREDPLPDPNLIYQIVDANGLDEITINVGQTVTLYVDMVTVDVNEVWAFDVEVDISDPSLGSIDNTAYDPNNPPGTGTARILAGPDRWAIFDGWGPGYEQEQGITLSGVSAGDAFEDGHLASFEFTCLGAGDVILTLLNSSTISTTGQPCYPTVEEILIHQTDPNTQMMASSSMILSLMAVNEPSIPSLSPEQMIEFLETIWLQDEGIQEMISRKDWQAFLNSIQGE